MSLIAFGLQDRMLTNSILQIQFFMSQMQHGPSIPLIQLAYYSCRLKLNHDLDNLNDLVAYDRYRPNPCRLNKIQLNKMYFPAYRQYKRKYHIKSKNGVYLYNFFANTCCEGRYRSISNINRIHTVEHFFRNPTKRNQLNLYYYINFTSIHLNEATILNFFIENWVKRHALYEELMANVWHPRNFWKFKYLDPDTFDE